MIVLSQSLDSRNSLRDSSVLVSSLFFKGAVECNAPKTIFNIQYMLSDCVIGMLVRLTSASKVKHLV